MMVGLEFDHNNNDVNMLESDEALGSWLYCQSSEQVQHSVNTIELNWFNMVTMMIVDVCAASLVGDDTIFTLTYSVQ